MGNVLHLWRSKVLRKVQNVNNLPWHDNVEIMQEHCYKVISMVPSKETLRTRQFHCLATKNGVRHLRVAVLVTVQGEKKKKFWWAW